MKYFITIVLTFFILFSYSQTNNILSERLNNKQIKCTNRLVNEGAINLNNIQLPSADKNYLSSSESQLGTTSYDFQTNGVIGNRVYFIPETNELAAVWNEGQIFPDFNDRRIGYRYFNGSEWLNDVGPESSVITGWPSIGTLGNNGEIIVCHNFDAGELIFYKRNQRGQGEWTQLNFQGPSASIAWPQIAVGGNDNNSLHLIALTQDEYQGQTASLLYSRSLDGGESWVDNNILFEDLSLGSYAGFSPDGYKIIADDNHICIFLVSPWHDLFYLESLDNGEVWNKKMIWEHPYPNFDFNTTITTDTIFAPDGSFDAEIDNNGKVHITFPITRVIHTEVGDDFVYFPFTDGILYWNDEMPPFENEDNQHYALSIENLPVGTFVGHVIDMNGDGIISLEENIINYKSLGLSTSPTIDIDDDVIAITYSSPHEGLTIDMIGNTYNLRHVYSVGYSITYDILGYPIWVSQDFLHTWDEFSYFYSAGFSLSVIEKEVNLITHIDIYPGGAVFGDHDYSENRIVARQAGIWISNDNLEEESVFEVSQNYPNPAKEITYFDISSEKELTVIVELRNSLGQLINIFNYTVIRGNSTMELNINNLLAGIYYFSIKSEDSIITKKIIIK